MRRLPASGTLLASLVVLAAARPAGGEDVAVTVRALKDERAECRFLRTECDAAKRDLADAVRAWSEADGTERLALGRAARERARSAERRIGTIVGALRAKRRAGGRDDGPASALPACVRDCELPELPWTVQSDAAACDAAGDCGR
ncbi:MAG TPA: hypothetical protein VFD84_10885 [Candidatus Binatia bacterium]|nr:hypothetical protein [Candidatus Binatia bacterium]